MCTSMTFQTDHFYFGRNLDLEYSFGEEVVITPREYPFSFHFLPPMPQHYAMIGMANIMEGYPLYAEAVNEKGLCMAGLNFPGNACFFEKPEKGKLCVAPYELIPWLLGSCGSLEEARGLLQKMRLVDISFRKEVPNAPLHWHIADKTGSLVVESTCDGLHLYDNPVGILTNNPPFPFHLTNLTCHMNLTSAPAENRFCPQLSMQPFGQGMGGVGLPGDDSPTSRFVRAAFYKWNSVCEPNENASVSQFFHILCGVSMVRGAVRTPKGQCDVTAYSCCVNADEGVYYYKTYDNEQITAVRLHGIELNSCELAEFPLLREQQIRFLN